MKLCHPIIGMGVYILVFKGDTPHLNEVFKPDGQQNRQQNGLLFSAFDATNIS